ncbi:MAG: hypothetical protein IPM27_02885 [Nitrosomonadales bacterium]|nr:hypothetical protein [Nitrosomonadales bacterium]
MNRIRAGKILRLPDQDELMSVAQTDAAKEIRAQAADWNAYRQRLASAAEVGSQTEETQQAVSGKITSSVEDKAPVAGESAKEVLRLSKGEAPGDEVAAAGKAMTAADKKNAAQEEAIARGKAAEEERTRAALLESNLKEMERLAELKTEAAALAQSAEIAVSGVVASDAASAVAAASEVQPAPVAKPKPKVKVVEAPPPPSMLDQILEEPLYLAGGAIALLGLGGAGFMLTRRRKEESAATATTGHQIVEEGNDADVGTITGRIAAPVVPSPDTGDFTATGGEHHAEAAHQTEDVDPLSEADLFLNFGRDAQAEEILKEALQNNPNNHQIHLKLLGIYANRKDANAFAAIARQLQDSGDDEAWQQAAAMGSRLEPNNPMYGGAGDIEDTGSATTQTAAMDVTPDFLLDDTAASQESAAPDVDFDLGGAGSSTADVSSTEETVVFGSGDLAAAAQEPDFDITSGSPSSASTEETVVFGSDDLSAAQGMDFDITSTTSSTPVESEPAEAEALNLDELIFDVTSTKPPAAAEEPEAAKPAAASADDGGMEFILDFPTEKNEPEAPAAAPSASAGFGGISLNLDDDDHAGADALESTILLDRSDQGTPASGGRDEHWQEVATKLDLAKAYQEMGDASGAREILDEVMREGDEEQRASAQSMLDQLG